MTTLTQHATCRMQQRGIKAETLEVLFVCGSKEHDRRGATILYFDKSARQRLRHQYGPDRYKRVEGQLDAYAVLAEDGTIITVGHRTKRINRH